MTRATLANLVQTRSEHVETSAGVVVVSSKPFQDIAPLMDLDQADQASHLLAVCVDDPPMTVEEAKQLPPDITMQLVGACMKVNGLDQPD